MTTLQTIAEQWRREALSGRGLPCGDFVYEDKPARYMPSPEETYGSVENRDRWYALEVRKVTGGKLFTPEIAHEANRGYTKAIGADQHVWGHFSLHSNPEDLLQYLDRSQFTVQYKGVAL